MRMLLLGCALLVVGCEAASEDADALGLTGVAPRSPAPSAASKPPPAASSSGRPSTPAPAPSGPPTTPQTPSDPGSVLAPIGCEAEAPEPSEGGRLRLRAQVCGTVGPDDVDRYAFEAGSDRAVVFKLFGAEVIASVAGCGDDRKLGDGERLRVIPSRDCTLRIDVSTKRPEPRGYVLVREK